MRTSEQIGALAEALSVAQGKFENPTRNRKVHVKTKTGDGYDFHYATLDRILEQVRPILSENRLALIQSAEMRDGRIVVTSRLAHASGEWIESDLSLLPETDDPQKCGSVITYGKRYLLTSMLAISADEDDDGNTGSGNHVANSEERPPCPQCGTNKSVIVGKPEYGGGFVCFAKKGGCGHKWQDATPAEPPKNGRSKEVAAAHGMKTADELPPKSELFQKALDKISAAVREGSPEEIARIMNVADTNHAAKHLSDNEHKNIVNECTVALRKIKAMEQEPLPA